MFQCLGLGTVEEGGCGEDWWHPECLVGFTRENYAKTLEQPEAETTSGALEKPDMSAEITELTIKSESTANAETNGHMEGTEPFHIAAINGAVTNGNVVDGNDIAAEAKEDEDDDPPLPPGFPAEDDFDHFICYKCLAANPWIEKYAGSPGFLPPVYNDKSISASRVPDLATPTPETTNGESKKRKASDDDNEDASFSNTLAAPTPAKRQKSEDPSGVLSSIPEDTMILPITPKKHIDSAICRLTTLSPSAPQALTTPFSLFLQPDFREHLCHCASCFPLLKAHPQLLEEEDTYEPPVSEEGDEGAASVGTGSILDRGEAAFNNMDRVRAIQGAMAYAHLKDKVAAFLKPFAESGQAVGAEDVKAYFEKLRGDEQGIQDAAGGAKANQADGDSDGGAGDGRREQSGY